MKICKTIIITLMLLLTVFATRSFAETNFQVTDDLGDVVNENDTKVADPNIDIKDVTLNKDGGKIDLSFSINESGTFLESGQFIYLIYLTTTSDIYTIAYGTKIFIGIFGYAGYEEFGNESISEIDAVVFTDTNLEVDLLDEYNINSNVITFSFNLVDNYEEIVGVQSRVLYTPGVTAVTANIDELNYIEDLPIVDAGGPYNAKAGKKITFTGSIDEGNPDDYTWIWTIDDTSVVKKGQSVKHNFLIPGDYTGTLYIRNSQLQYTFAGFEVQVNGTAVNNNNNNNGPGFEILIIFVAFAVALIILKKRK